MGAKGCLYAAADSTNPLKGGSHMRRSALRESSSRLAAHVQTRNRHYWIHCLGGTRSAMPVIQSTAQLLLPAMFWSADYYSTVVGLHSARMRD
jgi:hypothetical protein